jgi:hypothetical protein
VRKASLRRPTQRARVKRIETLGKNGVSIRGVAEALNEAGVPTAHEGQRWHASIVQKALASREGR